MKLLKYTRHILNLMLKRSYKNLIEDVHYYPLKDLEEMGFKISKLPYSIKILIENVYRNLDGEKITEEDLEAIANWKIGKEFAFLPTRVILQDYTGVPLLVDLAAMRSELKRRGLPADKINPIIPSDLVIDHSVQVDYYGTARSLLLNMKKEFERNLERYRFLKWAQLSFKNLRVVPPGNGIVHQVNLEYLSKVIDVRELNGIKIAFPEIVIGTDSHTPMVNGASVLAWGVGGLEAEAVMLGEPYYMQVPEVVGVRLIGEPVEGVTTTDIVLYITEQLRKKGVVNKFVEFFGPSLSLLSVPERATIGNMAPEYGATVGFFPIDNETLKYLEATGRNSKIVEIYSKAQGLFYSYEPVYAEVVEIDLSKIEPSIAGPRNPDERIPLAKAKEIVSTLIRKERRVCGEIFDGAIALAAITSCTNTSNPSVLIGAGILAKNAIAYGLRTKPYVKTSLAPGSPVVVEYLKRAGLLPYLEALGFHVVGFGCTTCIGNSGPLPKSVEECVKSNDIQVFGVISGNRNFEGRIHPLLKGTFLASPILVVAYAIAGRIDIDFDKEPIGYTPYGDPVYLRDIWPSNSQIKEYIKLAYDPTLYIEKYKRIFEGDENWKSLKVEESSETYNWDEKSTYIKEPPWFSGIIKPIDNDIENARILLLLGDKITTDHISPAGPITPDSPAGKLLLEAGEKDLNTYGARRGNHEVMWRGGFANPKLKNLLVDREGGYTIHFPSGKIASVYEVAEMYRKENIPLVVVAGKQYGSGSSRDWAAKVTALLGIRAVLAESFERIHRSNLVAMGVLPIQIPDWRKMGIKGNEIVNIRGLKELTPRKEVEVEFIRDNNEVIRVKGIALVNTKVELEYLKQGGILNYVFKKFLNVKS